MTKALGFVLLRMIDAVGSLGNRASQADWHETPERKENRGPPAPVHPRIIGPFSGKIAFKPPRRPG